MARKSGPREKITLRSTAGSGYIYRTQKNKRNSPDCMEIRMYDPVVRKHVIFREAR